MDKFHLCGNDDKNDSDDDDENKYDDNDAGEGNDVIQAGEFCMFASTYLVFQFSRKFLLLILRGALVRCKGWG